jgi:putative peptidoglycan lipid II flippase
MREERKLARSAVIVAGASLGGKVLGFLREVVFAAVFGASALSDAYFAALTVPVIFFGVVGSALTSAGVPVFSAALHSREREKDLPELIWGSFHALVVVLAGITLFAFLLAPWLVPVLAPGFSLPQAQTTLSLLRIMLPMVLFIGLAGWAQGVLNTFGHFTLPALMGVPYNLIMIAGILAAGACGGIYGVAWATLAAAASQFLIQVPALFWQGVGYRRFLNWRQPGLRQIFYLSLPILVGLGTGQLGVVVERVMASGLAEGSISALSYAQKAVGIAQGLLAVPLITVLYPSLSEKVAFSDRDGFRRWLGRGLTLLAFLLLPLAAGLMVLRNDLIRFLFQRGAFDAGDTQLTALALFFYAPGLLFAAWRDILIRGFYALQDTATPMWIGFATLAGNVLFNLFFVRFLAHGGLALGSSLASALACLLLFFFLHRRTGSIDVLRLFGEVARILLAAALMAVFVWWLAGSVFPAGSLGGYAGGPGPGGGISSGGFAAEGLRLLFLAATGGTFYAACCRLLKVKETEFVLALVLSRRRGA